MLDKNKLKEFLAERIADHETNCYLNSPTCIGIYEYVLTRVKAGEFDISTETPSTAYLTGYRKGKLDYQADIIQYAYDNKIFKNPA